MRGILPGASAPDAPWRISPAHAGNTFGNVFITIGLVDQPRTCGEYAGPSAVKPARPGSAPHMRGILPVKKRRRVRRRISPAHAGNTNHIPIWSSRYRDQPRTCGEYAPRARVGPRSGGSAPHMRGILRARACTRPASRISPAHAGNTGVTPSAVRSRPDQPRTCGEYHDDGSTLLQMYGSAPHMRGIH